MNKPHTDLSNSLTRSMCRTANELLDYDYVLRHYKGDTKSTVIQDHLNRVINNLGILLSDLDIYMETLGINAAVQIKVDKRKNRISKKEKNSIDTKRKE